MVYRSGSLEIFRQKLAPRIMGIPGVTGVGMEDDTVIVHVAGEEDVPDVLDALEQVPELRFLFGFEVRTNVYEEHLEEGRAKRRRIGSVRIRRRRRTPARVKMARRRMYRRRKARIRQLQRRYRRTARAKRIARLRRRVHRRLGRRARFVRVRVVA